MEYISRRRKGVSLDGKWLMAKQESKTISRNLPKDFKTFDWFSVKIPQSVHSGLWEAKRIKDPYFGTNAKELKWIQEKNWWFQKSFSVPKKWKGKHTWLYFEGIDYYGHFWLNGVYLGKHEGPYGGPLYDISSHLNLEQENRLIVCLESTKKYEENYPAKGIFYGNVGCMVKGWATHGWFCEDLKSMGIWRSVRLVVTEDIFLETPFIFTRKIEKDKAFLEGSVEIYNLTKQNREVGVVGKIDRRNSESGTLRFREEVNLVPGKNILEFKLEASNPDLWWPYQLGRQNLYLLGLELVAENKIIDKLSTQFGIRTLEWDGLKLSINGYRIFLKGTLYLPLDLLLEEKEERIDWLLSLIKNAHINSLRLWGHGHIQSSQFYQRCDEIGILLWQEFPMSCDFDKKEGYHRGKSREAWNEQLTISIKGLRNHPSLIAWCAGNEFSPEIPGNKDLVEIAKKLSLGLDGTRLFWPSSPNPPVFSPLDPPGDCHPYIFFSGCDFTWYKNFKDIEMASEFGIPGSIPTIKNLRKFLPKEEIKEIPIEKLYKKSDSAFVYHWSEEYVGHFSDKIPDYIKPYGKVITIKHLITYANLAQGIFNKYAIDFWRSNWPTTSGLFHCSFNQIWPSVLYCDAVDWYGQPMTGYYYLKGAYEPIHICAVFPYYLWKTGEVFLASVYVINDTIEIIRDCEVIATIRDKKFNTLWERSSRVDIAGRCNSSKVLSVKWQIPENLKDSVFLLGTTLKDRRGKIVSRSIYFPVCSSLLDDEEFRKKYRESPQKMLDFKDGPWVSELSETKTKLSLDFPDSVRIKGGRGRFTLKIKNVGDVPSFQTAVEINSPDCLYYCSDNYFLLLPKEEKEIKVISKTCKEKFLLVEVSAWNAPGIKRKLKV